MPRKTAKNQPSPQPTIAEVARPEPGTVIHREPVSTLELRVATLESMFDLMSLRLAIAESTAQGALERLKLMQRHEHRDLLGL